MPAGNSSQINAWAGGVAPDPVTRLPPVDDSTTDPPVLARTLAATALTRREKASFWAVLNVGPATSKGWEYAKDCANFVPKALVRGGKFRQIHIADWRPTSPTGLAGSTGEVKACVAGVPKGGTYWRG
ncbi:hypothetical protein [Microtetraspora malaysiensis]|uniref:hypothetical protein n=1 Tax=Microtetraspora malaysiensis TaxID=161358 RepID=UPI00082E7138|nr:hypothetical protein [Microtetraspora malaysiensis]